MSNIAFLDALKKIYNRLSDVSCDWVITGSFGFLLQGMPVTPHDIDIQTDKDGAYKIESALSEFVVKPVTFLSSGRIQSYFGVLKIDSVKVEIMGDLQKRLPDGTWEEPVDITKYRKFVEIDDMIIPVLDLEYEYRAYLNLGRTEKAKMLQDWIDRGKL